MLRWEDIIFFATKGNPGRVDRITRTDDEWRARLTPEEFRVTRRRGTEAPFSSEMCGLFGPGRYTCRCCGTLLFDSSQKYDSGTGWPSFGQPVAMDVIAYRTDDSHGMERIETICNVCDAHLGHVFPDGPGPSGLRYCMNAVALQKVDGTEQE